jgi:hypothetical protein
MAHIDQRKQRCYLPARGCSAPRHDSTGCCRASFKASPLAGEGCIARKTLSPGGGGKTYKRRLLPLGGKEGTVKGTKSHTRESSETSAWQTLPMVGSPCSAPGTRMGSTGQKPNVVGKRRTSLLAPSEVKTNETGRSRPISAACHSAWRTARLIVPPGHAIAERRLTLFSLASRSLWYPLEI